MWFPLKPQLEKQEAGKSQHALGSGWAEMGHQEPSIWEMHLPCILPTRNLLKSRPEPQMSPFSDPAVALTGCSIQCVVIGMHWWWLSVVRPENIKAGLQRFVPLAQERTRRLFIH